MTARGSAASSTTMPVTISARLRQLAGKGSTNWMQHVGNAEVVGAAVMLCDAPPLVTASPAKHVAGATAVAKVTTAPATVAPPTAQVIVEDTIAERVRSAPAANNASMKKPRIVARDALAQTARGVPAAGQVASPKGTPIAAQRAAPAGRDTNAPKTVHIVWHRTASIVETEARVRLDTSVLGVVAVYNQARSTAARASLAAPVRNAQRTVVWHRTQSNAPVVTTVRLAAFVYQTTNAPHRKPSTPRSADKPSKRQ